MGQNTEWEDIPAAGAWEDVPAKPARKVAAPSVLQSFGRGAASGMTFGFAPTLAGLSSNLDNPDNYDLVGDQLVPKQGAGFGVNKQARDAYRAADDAAKSAHPTANMAGKVAGGLVSTPLLPMARTYAGGVGVGTLAGGLSGLGESRAEDPVALAKDAAVGAGGGALISGVVAPVVGAVAKPVLTAVAARLRDAGINMGRRFLRGGVNSFSPKEPLREEAVQAAVDAGAIRPFASLPGAQARLSAAREEAGQRVGDILAELEARGVQGPNARNLASSLAAEGQNISANTLGSPRAAQFFNTARELIQKQPTGNLGLVQAENMKRELQHVARAEYDKLNALQTPAGEAKEAIASRMRDAVEKAVDAQRSLAPGEAAAFQPAKEIAGNLIAADNAAYQGLARSKNRNAFSLRDVVASGAAAGGGLAHFGAPGLIAGPVAAVASNIARNRLPSTAAWASLKGSQALQSIASQVQLARLLRTAASARAPDVSQSLKESP